MALVLSDPTDIVNAALVQIGYTRQIGDLYDGSDAARVSLAIYGQTRDTMLRDGNWGFASRTIIATLLKSAPVGGYLPPVTPWNPATNPPLGWLYEYAYPDDCLKVRAVKAQLFFIPNFDPVQNPFNEVNDNAYSPPRKVIVTNVENAMLVYTGQVTDPLTWEATFTEALVKKLGENLVAPLMGVEAKPLAAAEADGARRTAESEQG